MNDTSNVPESENQKPNVIDIKCTTQSGNQYIVLLEVIKEKKDINKMFVYSSLALVNQYNPRKYVQSFIPVIVVGILDFISFKNPNYLSHHCFLDQETKEQKIKDFEYYFIELPKFKKKLEELTTLAEKWIYFLSNAHEQSKVPDNLVELKDAFLVLKKTNNLINN